MKIILSIIILFAFKISQAQSFIFDDSKEPFDTIRCKIDTGKKINGWAIVKVNPNNNRSIDPGFSNLLIDYGYNLYGCLMEDRKTKVKNYFIVYKY